jgi:hypothetical protein
MEQALLDRVCTALVERLDASAAAISRAVGDVLVQVAEDAGERPTLQLGHGYLISDFPETRRVLDERVARTVQVGAGDADEAEVAVLDQLGFGALLMLPVEVEGEAWRLAEVYRERERPFGADDAARGLTLLRELIESAAR